MNEEKVCYEKEQIIQVIRDLNVLVVSTDRIGSAEHNYESVSEYNADFLRFFDEFGFFKKLAAARRILEESFSEEVGDDGLDELERNMQDLKYWGDQ